MAWCRVARCCARSGCGSTRVTSSSPADSPAWRRATGSPSATRSAPLQGRLGPRPEDSAEAWQPGLDGGALTLARPATVAPRVADNLVWLGRYSERAEDTVRLLRRCLDLASDYGRRPGTRGAQVLAAVASRGSGSPASPSAAPTRRRRRRRSGPRSPTRSSPVPSRTASGC
ncbi:alpha-E domain-containing protein [Tessaracoccus sp. HDW20]|uniref:alpha-E domain-containing protein n=1 Tax=Tessaracoccus coleopterorum TaxID=2714950 RepID=UPI0018D3678A|nr:alpha-E domain-containing protein [Tessaracoccus coleopterorum]